MNKFIISGAGFRGFCDAIELAKIPGSEVTIIEPAPFFGGILNSFKVKEFYVDKGVNMFDSIPRSLAEILTEIMDGQVDEIDYISASAYNGIVTNDFSLPDLNSINDNKLKETIKKEVIELSKKQKNIPDASNLHEYFCHRYGDTASQIFSDIFQHIYNISSLEVEPAAIAQTSMGRLKFLDDTDMLDLKSSDQWLDSVLAARRKTLGNIDDLVSIYPNDGKAMKGWCDKAIKWLQNKGIKVLLNEKIKKIEDTKDGVIVSTDKQILKSNKVIWSNDNVSALGDTLGIDTSSINQYQYGTPMLFVTLMTQKNKIKDFTYIQNFGPRAVTFRTAASGIFSKQEKNGISFITCECPIKIDSDDWECPEKIIDKVWKEVKQLGVVAEGSTLVDSDVIKIPTSFKLAKLDYSNNLAKFIKEVYNRTNNVHLRNTLSFFRRDIYFDSLKLRDELNV